MFADRVKLAVGAGVLLIVIDKLELAIEVPQALLANTSIDPEPFAVLAAVILITFVEEGVAVKLPLTIQL